MKALVNMGWIAAGVWATASAAAEIAPTTEHNAFAALGTRAYLSPMSSYTFADSGRQTESGFGVSLSFGRLIGDRLLGEISGQYQVYRRESDDRSMKMSKLTANGLFFPTANAGYALIGVGYGDVRSHPGNDAGYGTALFNLGAGYLWKPAASQDVVVRLQGLWRLDAHNDRRTGDSIGNGRKAFNDIVVSVGLLIPLGSTPRLAAPTPEPVVVMPVDTGEPAPSVEPPAPPVCRSPEPGQAADLAGCATGDLIVLRGVTFNFDSAMLTPTATTTLDGVAESLKRLPSLRFEVGGHTDAIGSDAYNDDLSKRRAQTVADHLQSQGITGDRMRTHGYGAAHPIADNATDEGRDLNRRVELKIIEADATTSSASSSYTDPAVVDVDAMSSTPDTDATIDSPR